MASRPQRLALGPRGRRLSFERRLRQKLWLMGIPVGVLAAALLRSTGWVMVAGAVVGIASVWAVAISLVMESIVRPLQTLANVIAALREDDFSFRARGGRRDDALGDLALEVNALAGLLQGQRGSALEAIDLAGRVMNAMQTPVLAFDAGGQLRMVNPAAERTFRLVARTAVGSDAASLGLVGLLDAGEEEPVMLDSAVTAKPGARWVVKRTGFRIRGMAHTLLVLSEVSSVLREEERSAWRRLVRVMGHEINNSLTPIKSIAGSLRARLPATIEIEGVRVLQATDLNDLERGLAVIENRAESLNRFLQGYRHLSGLPAPRLTLVPAALLVERVAHLVHGLPITIERGPETLALRVDEDQIQQALINLLKNAVEAAQSAARERDEPSCASVGWGTDASGVVLYVLDNGAGVANAENLFVPFYTTKPGGTGIGLALALQIAEAHGGTVRLSNRVDTRGCRAELYLPRAEGPAPTALSTAAL